MRSQILPAMWRWSSIGAIGSLLRGVSYKREDAVNSAGPGLIPVLRATNIGQSLNFEDLVFVPERYVSAEQLLRPGDIVIAASSGSASVVGKAAPLPHHWRGSFGAFCLALRPANINPMFLAYHLQTSEYRNRVSGLAAGVNINNLKRQHIEETPIPLPPPEEQQLIVAEIEKHFTRLDAAVASLKQAQVKLKAYRASVLDGAVQCVPPADRPGEIKTTEQLPPNWRWVSMSELADGGRNAIFAGPFGTLFKAKDFRAAGVPIIFLRHVAPGRYLTHKPGFMDEMKWRELFEPYSVHGGELLVTKLGEPPGVAAIYPHGLGPAMVTPDVIAMRVNQTLLNPVT